MGKFLVQKTHFSGQVVLDIKLLFFGLLAETFRGDCPNCILRWSTRECFQRKFCHGEVVFVGFCTITGKKLAFCWSFSGVEVKTAVYVSNGTLGREESFPKQSQFFKHFRTLSNNQPPRKKPSAELSKLRSSCPKSILRINIFLENLQVFTIFGHCVIIFRPVCRNFSAVLSKLHSICPLEHFG